MRPTIRYTLLACCALLLWNCRSAYQKATTHFKRGEYQSAIENYTRLIGKEKLPANVNSADLYYKIGESYRQSNRLDQALSYYRQALDASYPNDSLLFVMAQAHKMLGEYEEARKLFGQYAKTGSHYEAKKMAQKTLENAALIDSLRIPNPYIRLLHLDSLNTENSEYAPALLGDTLVFTSSRRPEAAVYKGTGTNFTDLYYIPTGENETLRPPAQLFGASVNQPFLHEAAATFSADGKTMVFARSNPGKKKDKFTEVDLYVCYRNDEGWSAPRLLSLSKNNSWDSTPALSPDGKTLYFASNRKGSLGGTDIFKAIRSNDGDFKGVTPLGSPVNTPGNELFPSVSPEGKLYFSSDGHPGLGGLDLFCLDTADAKLVVKNLGAPFNSPKDDFALAWKTDKTGYFSSNRTTEGAKGDDDIFYFADDSPTLEDIEYFLAGTTFNINYEKQKNRLPHANVVLQDAAGKVLEQKKSDEQGRYLFETPLTIGDLYLLNGKKIAHFPDSTHFDTKGKAATEADLAAGKLKIIFETRLTLKQDLFKGKLEGGGEEIVLENILYDLDKANIRPDAAKELDKLVQYMKDRPTLKIELGSHTDVRGRDSYNMRLSKRRAESAVKYIVSQGIEASRITAKGYGETKLAVKKAKTEEEHQKNRRTTVRVIE